MPTDIEIIKLIEEHDEQTRLRIAAAVLSRTAADMSNGGNATLALEHQVDDSADVDAAIVVSVGDDAQLLRDVVNPWLKEIRGSDGRSASPKTIPLDDEHLLSDSEKGDEPITPC